MDFDIRQKTAWEDGPDGSKIFYDVWGTQLKVGDKAPDFSLVTDTGSLLTLNDSPDTSKLIMLVNSVDTPVCKEKTCELDGLLQSKRLPSGAIVYTVSMDLPFALQRFRQDQRISPAHSLVSASRSGSFGIQYGALMMPDRLLQRAVFVLDPSNTIRHVEYFQDQGVPPNYELAHAALRQIAVK